LALGPHMSDPIPVSRRLAADVEGYSRLMGSDEVGTLKGLTERRAILDRIIREHRGGIANTAGCPCGVRTRCGGGGGADRLGRGELRSRA